MKKICIVGMGAAVCHAHHTQIVVGAQKPTQINHVFKDKDFKFKSNVHHNKQFFRGLGFCKKSLL